MKKTLKTLIIDDEELFLKDLLQKLAETGLPYHVIGYAYDGETALSMMHALKPDVVITDIRLPGIDGLELIEAWQKQMPNTYFVLVSGFMDFNYARQAIRLGVEEYITKPVDLQKLTDTLSQLLKKAKNDLLKAQKRYIIDQITGMELSDNPDIPFENTKLGMMHITIGNRLRYGVRIPENSIYVTFFATFSWTSYFYKKVHGSSWIVPAGAKNEKYLLFSMDEHTPEKLAEQLLRAFTVDYPSKQITISYCQTTVDFHKLQHTAVLLTEHTICHLQAWRSGCYPCCSDVRGPFRVMHAKNVGIPEYLAKEPPSDPEELLHKTIPSAIRTEYASNPNQCSLEAYIISMTTTLQRFFPPPSQPVLLANRTTLAGLIGISASLDVFLEDLEQTMLGIYKNCQPKEEQQYIDISEAAKQVLDDNYRNPISITSVAKELYVTDTYLIRSFKQKFQISPLQYLIDRRMTEAERLLQFSDACIAEIAEAVGYNDVNYFNRLFKKHKGLTPAAYRRMLR